MKSMKSEEMAMPAVDHPAGRAQKSRAPWRTLTRSAVITVAFIIPALVIRITGLHPNAVVALLIYGAAVVAAIFKADAIPVAERLDVQIVVDDLKRRGRPAWHLTDADAIVSTIAPELKAGDVVAILSNGGFGGIYEKLPARL